MAGRPHKRPTVDVLHALQYEAVTTAVSTRQLAARIGVDPQTLRSWWRNEGIPAPRKAQQASRQSIMAAVLKRHPDARRSDLRASVCEVYPGTVPQTIYLDMVRMGVPTQHKRRRAEVLRLMLERSPASGVEIHADMKARGWSAGVCIVRAIMRALREEGVVEHYQQQTAEQALRVNERHELLRKLIDEQPDATDAELSVLMAERGHPAAVKTVGLDRRCMGIPSAYKRRAAALRDCAREYPDLTPAELLSVMQNDDWRITIQTVRAILRNADRAA